VLLKELFKQTNLDQVSFAKANNITKQCLHSRLKSNWCVRYVNNKLEMYNPKYTQSVEWPTGALRLTKEVKDLIKNQ
jgi:hypothetical protein